MAYGSVNVPGVSGAEFTAHTDDKTNPHAVTKAQVGLGNVDNTSDADKPVSNATQTALNGKANVSHTHSEYASTNSPTFSGGDISMTGDTLSLSMNRSFVLNDPIGKWSVALCHHSVATGECSLAEGERTRATGNYSHAEGSRTEASGNNSHAEGSGTGASGSCSHAEGNSSIASSNNSHAEGNGTKASGLCSHAEGNNSHAEGNYSHAEGISTKASGGYSHAEGSGTVASGNYSHAEGISTKASGDYCHAEGTDTEAKDAATHAEGSNTVASWRFSHAEGCVSISSRFCSHAEGYGTIANADSQHSGGAYNIESTLETDKFIIGKGTSDSARANCFRVTHTGVYASGSYNSSGADYAELFEWQDGNPDNVDRIGLFVTLDGEKIRLAEPDDDFILGVISGNPSVVGDVHDDQWQGMYLYDIYGRPLWEDVEIPAEYEERETVNEDGETVTEKILIREAHTEHRQVLNPDYDGSQPYQKRTERKEWGCVGMMGKLVVNDDGSCVVNGWAKPGEGGIAVKSETPTKYRVMSRIDDTHVRILIL